MRQTVQDIKRGILWMIMVAAIVFLLNYLIHVCQNGDLQRAAKEKREELRQKQIDQDKQDTGVFMKGWSP